MPLTKRPHGKGGVGQRQDQRHRKRSAAEIAQAVARGYKPIKDKSTAHSDIGKMSSKRGTGQLQVVRQKHVRQPDGSFEQIGVEYREVQRQPFARRRSGRIR